jgi:hypothetical protein
MKMENSLTLLIAILVSQLHCRPTVENGLGPSWQTRHLSPSHITNGWFEGYIQMHPPRIGGITRVDGYSAAHGYKLVGSF